MTQIHKENTGIIIQVRLGSTRLPGKVLLPLGNTTVLEFMIKRLSHALFDVYLAIAEEEDDRLCELALSLLAEEKIAGYHVGSVEDVYERTVGCAEEFGIEHIIDITSDCPFADPELVEDMFGYYKTGEWDYVSNIETRTFADGFDIQIYSTEELKEAECLCMKKEHSGWNITQGEANRLNITAPFKSYAPNLRITLDTPEDYALLCQVYGYLKNGWNLPSHPDYEVITKYLKRNYANT